MLKVIKAIKKAIFIVYQFYSISFKTPPMGKDDSL